MPSALHKYIVVPTHVAVIILPICPGNKPALLTNRLQAFTRKARKSAPTYFPGLILIVVSSMKAGAAGVCLFTPYSTTDEHWEALEKDTVLKSK